MKVGDVMTTDVRVAIAEEPVVDAVRVMFETGFGAVPVVSRQTEFKGIIRSADLAGMIARGIDLDTTPAGEVVVGYSTVIPEQGMDTARNMWVTEGTEMLAVTDNGRLAGVLTHYDFQAQQLLASLLGERIGSLVMDIAEEDRMFFGHRGAYMTASAGALEWIMKMLEHEHEGEVGSILDMGCGHGRVLRTLRAAFPDAAITACDENHGAADFCSMMFGARAAYAELDPARTELPDSYDLIWAGSLLPWIHPDRWPAMLALLGEHLREGGLLVMTTLAWQNSAMLRELGMPESDLAPRLADYEANGFAYQSRLETEGSGLTLTSPGWVRWIVNETPHLRVARQAQAAWATPRPREDVLACVLKDGAEG